MNTPRTCSTCSADCPPPPSGSGPSGYAISQDGRTLCYPCADKEQRSQMATATRWTAYIRTEPRPDHSAGPLTQRTRYIPTALTTWTGGILATIRYSDWTRTTFHLFGRTTCTLYSGTAHAADGSTWAWRHYDTGIGDIAHMRRNA